MTKEDCIFCKITAGEFNTEFVLETEDYVVFNDINPQAPVHALVIPRKHFSSMNELEEAELTGKLFLGAKEAAKALGVEDNYRLVVNTGKKAGQTVFHIHIHVLGGRDMQWPPG